MHELWILQMTKVPTIQTSSVLSDLGVVVAFEVKNSDYQEM